MFPGIAAYVTHGSHFRRLPESSASLILQKAVPHDPWLHIFPQSAYLPHTAPGLPAIFLFYLPETADVPPITGHGDPPA